MLVAVAEQAVIVVLAVLVLAQAVILMQQSLALLVAVVQLAAAHLQDFITQMVAVALAYMVNQPVDQHLTLLA
jgi:hypothetical protein